MVITVTTSESTRNASAILTNIDLVDIDDTNLQSAKVELTNFKTGDVIESASNTYGINVSINKGLVLLTGEATKSQYEEVLESLTCILKV